MRVPLEKDMRSYDRGKLFCTFKRSSLPRRARELAVADGAIMRLSGGEMLLFGDRGLKFGAQAAQAAIAVAGYRPSNSFSKFMTLSGQKR